MKRHASFRVVRSSQPLFELLEDRNLCSTTPTINADVVKKLTDSAHFAGVSDAVLNSALAKAKSGKKSDADQAQRMIIAAGLHLPPEALQTNLTAQQLVQQAANLSLIGADTKVQTPDYWKTVKAKGADTALAGVVITQLGIPESAAKGKSAKQLVGDSANIMLLTGDVQSPKAWQGLALLKSGKISVEQYAKTYADGADLKTVRDAARQVVQQARIRAKVTRVITKPKQNANNSVANNGYNPQTDVHTDKNYGNGIPYAQPTNQTNQAPAGTGTDGTTAEYTITDITHNSDGTTTVSWYMTQNGQNTSYTTTYYPADENGGAYYNVTDSSGAFVDGGTGTPPKDSTAGTTTQSTSGDQAIFPDDGSGSSNTSGSGNNSNNNNQSGGTANDKDGDGIPDDKDDKDDRDQDGDGKPDNEQSTTTTTDTTSSDSNTSKGDSNTQPTTGGYPTPDSGGPSKAARQNWLTSTPFGQAEMRSILGMLSLARSGGNADPEDPGVNPFARAAFYASPLFSNQPVKINNGKGNIDYVDDSHQNAVLDKRQLDAIAIRSGGAVGGPDTGKKPNTPPQNNPVTPPIGVTGGGTTAVTFSKVKVTAAVVVSSAVTAKLATTAATVAK